jgi:Phage tail protein (Tail_P2_I)
MSYTPTTAVGERLVEKMAPWLDANGDLARLLDSIGTMCEPLTLVIEDEGLDGEAGYVPGYGKLFNPEECPGPYLAYLGMYVGVPIPVGTSEAEARALIKAESGIARGTRASMESVIRRHLVPGASFSLIERRNLADEEDPYSFLVIIQGSKLNQSWFATTESWEPQTGKWEDPGTDTTDLEAAVNAAKPAGLVWSLILSESVPWLLFTGTWESQTTTWALA